MNDIVLERNHRVDNDIKLAQMALYAEPPIPEGVCVHAQQCAEKYLKAVLQDRNVEATGTHLLLALLGF